MLLSKFLKSFFVIACLCSLSACSNDEPNGESSTIEQDDNLSVTIKADGTTSNGASFTQLDGETFFLDHVKYKIIDSHLEIIDCDRDELPSVPKLYANVTIGNNIYRTRKIGIIAFANTNISSITLPSSITEIKQGAFADCIFLKQITLPKGLINLAGFNRCSSLTQIIIPDSVTTIREFTFDGCSSLTQVTLPNAITIIKEKTFRDCTSLTQVKLPDNLKRIGVEAFRGCSSLTQIKIPDTVTTIDSNAFLDCSSLTQVTFPNALTIIGSCAFYRCSSLSLVKIPDSLEKIELHAFNGCSSLKQITLPENLKHIGYRAFYNCNSLKKVTFLSLTPPEPEESSDLFDSYPIAYVKSEALETYRNWNHYNCFSEIKPINE